MLLTIISRYVEMSFDNPVVFSHETFASQNRKKMLKTIFSKEKKVPQFVTAEPKNAVLTLLPTIYCPKYQNFRSKLKREERRKFSKKDHFASKDLSCYISYSLNNPSAFSTVKKFCALFPELSDEEKN